MNSRYDNLLAGKDQTIKALWTALAVAACSALFMGVGWMLSPNFLRVYVPPDLSSGAVLKSNEVGKANVYSFGYYIWQQLYRWETNAATDYEDKIHMMQNYLTPSCFQIAWTTLTIEVTDASSSAVNVRCGKFPVAASPPIECV